MFDQIWHCLKVVFQAFVILVNLLHYLHPNKIIHKTMFLHTLLHTSLLEEGSIGGAEVIADPGSRGHALPASPATVPITDDAEDTAPTTDPLPDPPPMTELAPTVLLLSFTLPGPPLALFMPWVEDPPPLEGAATTGDLRGLSQALVGECRGAPDELLEAARFCVIAPCWPWDGVS